MHAGMPLEISSAKAETEGRLLDEGIWDYNKEKFGSSQFEKMLNTNEKLVPNNSEPQLHFQSMGFSNLKGMINDLKRFDKGDAEHVRLHKLFLPTLAATQSNYADDVVQSLQRVGFKLVLHRPSVAPTWPLTDQKTDLFLFIRSIVVRMTAMGFSPPWVETLVSNLLLGGVAWADAEKAKLADLNWQIIVEKPAALQE